MADAADNTKRTPYTHALHVINTVNDATNVITGLPDNPRGLPADTAASVLTVRSNLAIAAALLAVADAIRERT